MCFAKKKLKVDISYKIDVLIMLEEVLMCLVNEPFWARLMSNINYIFYLIFST
jgi:hypothetical protein